MKSVKLLSVTLLLTILMCLSLTACGNKTYTVTLWSYWNQDFSKRQCDVCNGFSLFQSHQNHYDGVMEKRQVNENGIVGNVDFDMKKAEEKGYKFCGWYTDQSYTVQWNTLLDPVKGDITLYAKWEPV